MNSRKSYCTLTLFLRKRSFPSLFNFFCNQHTATLLGIKRSCWRFDPRIISFLKYVYYVTRSLKRGKIELGVHIADVSHFVRPGSLTDTEAKTRYMFIHSFTLSTSACQFIVCAVKCVVYDDLTVSSYRPIRGTLFCKQSHITSLYPIDLCLGCSYFVSRVNAVKVLKPPKELFEKVSGDLKIAIVYPEMFQSSRAVERIKRNDCEQINIQSTCRLI